MKVLQVNKYFFLKGGAERVFFQERECLLSQGAQVVDFSMAHPDNQESEYAEFFVRNVDLRARHGFFEKIRIARSFVHNREAVANINALVERERPDIAHLHNVYHHLTPSIIPALKRRGVKVVLTLHDFKLVCPGYIMLDKDFRVCTVCRGRRFLKPLTTNCQGSRFRSGLIAVESLYHRWKRSYDGVDLFVAPSRFMAEAAAWRVPREKVAVLPNGIETHELTPTGRDLGYALFLGRLSREKGLHTLMKAHQGLDLDLKVVGTGPEEACLRQEYAAPEFVGYKSGDELFRLLGDSAFVVVPSEWHENCPMVVLEAMAFGKPVIASRMGGMPDLVEHGVTGFLFDCGDQDQLRQAMRTLAQDPELRLRMGRAAREAAETRFSIESHCRGLMSLYETVLAGGTP